jgi:inner membrane protein
MAACAALGALLPDIDAGTAKIAQLSIGRMTPLATISMMARDAFGHRGITHSMVGTVLVGGVAAIVAGHWLGLSGAVALLLGYASHLIGDACTVSGIPVLFPDRTRRFALPKALRFVTNSRTEDFLLVLFAEASLALLLPLLFPR